MNYSKFASTLIGLSSHANEQFANSLSLEKNKLIFRFLEAWPVDLASIVNSFPNPIRWTLLRKPFIQIVLIEPFCSRPAENMP